MRGKEEGVRTKGGGGGGEDGKGGKGGGEIVVPPGQGVREAIAGPLAIYDGVVKSS